MDLLAVDRHVIGRIDPETHLHTAVPEDRHRDVIADSHRLAASPREHQHRFPPCRNGATTVRSSRRRPYWAMKAQQHNPASQHAHRAHRRGGEREFEAGRHLDAEVGYGLGFTNTPSVITPFAGVSLGDASVVRGGARWSITPQATLSLEGAVRDAIDEDTPAEHAVTIRGAFRF